MPVVDGRGAVLDRSGRGIDRRDDRPSRAAGDAWSRHRRARGPSRERGCRAAVASADRFGQRRRALSRASDVGGGDVRAARQRGRAVAGHNAASRASIASRRSSRCAGVRPPTLRARPGRCPAARPTSRRGSGTRKAISTCSTSTSEEARVLELPRVIRAGRGQANMFGSSGPARSSSAHRDELGGRRPRPRVVLGPGPRRQRHAPAGLAARGASRAAPPRDRRAACSPSGRGRRRRRRSAGRSTRRPSTANSTFAMPELRGARASARPSPRRRR